MLNVSLAKLMFRAKENLLPGQPRSRGKERRGILELVAVSVGTGGLVVAATAPEPAADSLIDQPAIDKDVEGPVGRFNINRSKKLICNRSRPLEGPAAPPLRWHKS